MKSRLRVVSLGTLLYATVIVCDCRPRIANIILFWNNLRIYPVKGNKINCLRKIWLLSLLDNTFSFLHQQSHLVSGTNWLTWDSWKDCSVSCGGGTQIRYRNCNKIGGCGTDYKQSRSCRANPCPGNFGRLAHDENQLLFSALLLQLLIR